MPRWHLQNTTAYDVEIVVVAVVDPREREFFFSLLFCTFAQVVAPAACCLPPPLPPLLSAVFCSCCCSSLARSLARRCSRCSAFRGVGKRRFDDVAVDGVVPPRARKGEREEKKKINGEGGERRFDARPLSLSLSLHRSITACNLFENETTGTDETKLLTN